MSLEIYTTFCAGGARQTRIHARNIWIDAICTNQADPTERGSQIGLMRDIYSSAKTVIVWLGEENKHTLVVVDLIQRLPSIPMDRLRTINPLDLANTRTKAMMQLGNWKGSAELFQRAWFYRTWIIQEIAAASEVTVLCGGHTILWEDLLYISEVFSTSKWGGQVLSIFHKPGVEILQLVLLLIRWMPFVKGY